jgi:hypothetical protein
MGISVLRAMAAASIGILTVAPLTAADAPPAPPFPKRDKAAWIGPPMSWRDLAGRVVLLDVWTFG